MRLLMIGPVLPAVRGPMPRIVHLMAEALGGAGWTVELEHWGQHAGGESLPSKLVGRARDVRHLARRLADPTLDLVLVHSAHDLRALLREVPLVLAASRARVPIVYMFHGTPHRARNTPADRAWRWLFGWLVRRMAGVLVLSRAEQAMLERWYPGVHVWAARYPFRAAPRPRLPDPLGTPPASSPSPAPAPPATPSPARPSPAAPSPASASPSAASPATRSSAASAPPAIPASAPSSPASVSPVADSSAACPPGADSPALRSSTTPSPATPGSARSADADAPDTGSPDAGSPDPRSSAAPSSAAPWPAERSPVTRSAATPAPPAAHARDARSPAAPSLVTRSAAAPEPPAAPSPAPSPPARAASASPPTAARAASAAPAPLAATASGPSLEAADASLEVPTIAFVGRAIVDKGLLDLVQALPRVLAHTPARLVVCGDGPALAEARRIAYQTGISQAVEFLGWQSPADVQHVLERADVLVLPSVREGFPSVLLEAMAAGLPIITTPVGGIPDHLHEGTHALFVAPGDVPALATRIVALLDDPTVRARLGTANLACVQTFAPERVVADYLSILRPLARGVRPVARDPAPRATGVGDHGQRRAPHPQPAPTAASVVSVAPHAHLAEVGERADPVGATSPGSAVEPDGNDRPTAVAGPANAANLAAGASDPAAAAERADSAAAAEAADGPGRRGARP